MSGLLVSMPTFNTPRKLLDRAVRSVLAQSHKDLVLVVVNDGGKQLSGMPSDSRLVVFDLPENRGRYFADAVTTEAIAMRPQMLWSVHDADDWSEPGRFENLLPYLADGVAVAPYWRHQTNRRTREWVQEPSRARLKQPAEGFVHLAHWCSGVFSSERVQRAGGIHPGFRVGFDTLFVRMVALTGPVGIGEHKGYHWCRRDGGSLTTAPETRFGSQHRAVAKARLVKLDAAAWELRAKDPGRVIRDDISPTLRVEVEEQARKLAELIG